MATLERTYPIGEDRKGGIFHLNSGTELRLEQLSGGVVVSWLIPREDYGETVAAVAAASDETYDVRLIVENDVQDPIQRGSQLATFVGSLAHVQLLQIMDDNHTISVMEGYHLEEGGMTLPEVLVAGTDWESTVPLTGLIRAEEIGAQILPLAGVLENS